MTKLAITSFVCRMAGTCVSSLWRQATHTISSPANSSFATSIPGVAKDLCSSCGFEINFVWIFLGFSPNLTHIELRHSLARPRLAALYFIEIFSRSIPSLWRNDSMYWSSSVGVRTQLEYPLASGLSFSNVLIYSTKRPPSPVSLFYCVTLYSYNS